MLLDLREFRERHAYAGGAVLAVQTGDEEELLGTLVGQRLEENGVDDAENCGIRADAEGQREDGYEGEGGIFLQHAEGEFQVLKERGHQVPRGAIVSSPWALDSAGGAT